MTELNKEENIKVNDIENRVKVTLSQDCKLSLDENTIDINFSLSLPIKKLKTTKKLMAGIDDIKIDKSEDLEKWAKVFDESVSKYIVGDSLEESLTRQNSDWRQEVLTKDNESIRINAISNSFGGGSMSSDSALALINKTLDLGTVVKIPLWHSGFWVTLKSPTAATLMAVDRLLASEKIVLGRQTNGMLFSGVSVYLRKVLIDLILDCIVAISIEDCKKEDLLELIKITDYQTLLWGLVCSNYPDGYNLTQACVADLEKCNNILTERVMLSKLSWTDNDALTEENKKFIQEQKMSKVTKDNVLKYQNIINREEEVHVNEKLTVVLKVPNIKYDLTSGVNWVDSLVNMVDKLFAEIDMTDEIKNIRIMEQSKASALRQYSAWISCIKIQVGNGEDVVNVISDRKTIEAACDSLTSENKICKHLFSHIGKFIDSSVISLIGIPAYNCPNCEAPQNSDETSHPEIIPLAIDDIFFTLIRQLTERLIVQENIF